MFTLGLRNLLIIGKVFCSDRLQSISFVRYVWNFFVDWRVGNQFQEVRPLNCIVIFYSRFKSCLSQRFWWILQRSGQSVLQRGEGTCSEIAGGNIWEPGTGGRLPRQSTGKARATHGHKLLSQVPQSWAYLRFTSPFRSQCHHSSSSRRGVWLTSVQQWACYQPHS